MFIGIVTHFIYIVGIKFFHIKQNKSYCLCVMHNYCRITDKYNINELNSMININMKCEDHSLIIISSFSRLQIFLSGRQNQCHHHRCPEECFPPAACRRAPRAGRAGPARCSRGRGRAGRGPGWGAACRPGSRSCTGAAPRTRPGCWGRPSPGRARRSPGPGAAAGAGAGCCRRRAAGRTRWARGRWRRQCWGTGMAEPGARWNLWYGRIK